MWSAALIRGLIGPALPLLNRIPHCEQFYHLFLLFLFALPVLIPMSTPASTSTTMPSASQLVFALTNVYPQFSFKLSNDGAKYKLWRRIFIDLCKGTKVMGHITGKYKPTGDDDEDWEAIDSRVKSWFYSSCDASLLNIVSKDECTSKDMWDEI